MSKHLRDAIEAGDAEQVRVLLMSSSFDDEALTSAWKLAGEYGHIPILAALFEIDAGAPRHRGEAALRAASAADHGAAVEFLLARGVSERARVPAGAPATAHVEHIGGPKRQRPADAPSTIPLIVAAVVVVIIGAVILFVMNR